MTKMATIASNQYTQVKAHTTKAINNMTLKNARQIHIFGFLLYFITQTNPAYAMENKLFNLFLGDEHNEGVKILIGSGVRGPFLTMTSPIHRETLKRTIEDQRDKGYQLQNIVLFEGISSEYKPIDFYEEWESRNPLDEYIGDIESLIKNGSSSNLEIPQIFEKDLNIGEYKSILDDIEALAKDAQITVVVKPKDIALILRAMNVLSRITDECRKELAKKYRLIERIIADPNDIEEIVHQMPFPLIKNRKIAQLIIIGHGTEKTLAFSARPDIINNIGKAETHKLTTENLDDNLIFFKAIKGYLTDDANMCLISCSVGSTKESAHNIAQAFSWNLPGARVFAPNDKIYACDINYDSDKNMYTSKVPINCYCISKEEIKNLTSKIKNLINEIMNSKPNANKI